MKKEGPSAWLHYFAQTPQFFMAADGELVFSNNDSATVFIKNTLPKMISHITLNWISLRIDPLTNNIAVMAADYHEIIIDGSGKQADTNGYFTATAQKISAGWQLRNAHWSTLSGK